MFCLMFLQITWYLYLFYFCYHYFLGVYISPCGPPFYLLFLFQSYIYYKNLHGFPVLPHFPSDYLRYLWLLCVATWSLRLSTIFSFVLLVSIWLSLLLCIATWFSRFLAVIASSLHLSQGLSWILCFARWSVSFPSFLFRSHIFCTHFKCLKSPENVNLRPLITQIRLGMISGV